MKPFILFFLLPLFTALISCGNNSRGENISVAGLSESAGKDSPSSTNGLVGEWEQVHTIFDKNGNNMLDKEEMSNPSATKIGDYYLRFYANGKCEYSNLKMQGTYEVITEEGSKVIQIKGGDERRLKLLSMETNEMVLAPVGAPGTFLVYKKV